MIRADGEQLYGNSGSLPGDALLQMLTAAVAQSGRILNAQQQSTIETSIAAAREALDQDKLLTAARAIRPIAKIGTLGNLGSYAAAAIEADEIAKEISLLAIEQIEASEEKLADPESAFIGVTELTQLRDAFSSFPKIRKQLTTQLKNIKSEASQRDHLKPAAALAKARELAQSDKERDRVRAEKAFAMVAKKYPDTPASEAAEKELLTLNPNSTAIADLESEGAASAKSSGVDFSKEPYRTWGDASGKHNIVAMLIDIVGDEAQLVRKDGSSVSVPIERLGDAEQAYLRERR